MPERSVERLVKQLRHQDSAATEDQLVALGEEALDGILESVTDINGELKHGRDHAHNIRALEKHTRVLGRIKSPFGLRAILDALVDSAIAVRELKAQQDAFYDCADPVSRYNSVASGLPFSIAESLAAAKSLNKTAVNALVGFGETAIAPLERHLQDNHPLEVKLSLRRALGKVRKKWWQFWK